MQSYVVRSYVHCNVLIEKLQKFTIQKGTILYITQWYLHVRTIAIALGTCTYQTMVNTPRYVHVPDHGEQT